MCGIVGIIGSRKQLPASLPATMLSTLAHRGPDGQGIYAVENLWLGHQRLAIIDVEQGGQPMVDSSGDVVIVFNGEIYNYIELRQQLKNAGHHFTTQSDTEVLLKAYLEYGEACVRQLNGMFTFAIYDRRYQRIVLARDHFGVKPLYFSVTRNHLIFASEIKALLPFPDLATVPNWEAIHEYLTFQFCLGDKTLFKDIRCLEPATTAVIDIQTRKVKIGKFWEPDFEIDNKRPTKEYVDELSALVNDSVRLQLRSDVPLGSHLSGGIDSSLIATLAAHHLGRPPQTFHG